MALLMVLSVCTGAMAATPSTDIALEAAVENGVLTVEVYMTAEGVANGRIKVTYDKDMVTFLDVTPAENEWVISANNETAGVVYIAWVGSNHPAEGTLLATLTFDVAERARVVRCAVEVEELYTTEGEETPSQATDNILVVIEEDASEPLDPGVSIPTPPTTPVEPEDKDPEPEPDPEPEAQCPFTDIAGHWAEEYIITGWKAGLISGTTTTTYSPKESLTRGQFVTMLYRLAGTPEVTAENPFKDVDSSMYYADPVIWAYTNGVVKGVSETEFRPNSKISRQELVTMLMRYAVLTGESVDNSVELDQFADADAVASWAVDAMEWAVAEGIIIGTGTNLNPKGDCIRAEAATILVRHAGL